jgi:hypothetical protein
MQAARNIELEARIISDVKAIANRPFVVSVSDHYAGYWDELGLTLTLAPDSRDEDVIALQNELLVYLNRFWIENKPDFDWMVMFSRGTDKMVPLVAGDGPRTNA